MSEYNWRLSQNLVNFMFYPRTHLSCKSLRVPPGLKYLPILQAHPKVLLRYFEPRYPETGTKYNFILPRLTVNKIFINSENALQLTRDIIKAVDELREIGIKTDGWTVY